MATAKSTGKREAELEKRAASRGYSIEKDGQQWYVALAGTRWGPMDSLHEVDEFLPKEA